MISHHNQTLKEKLNLFTYDYPWSAGKHGFFYEHDHHYGAVSDKHIHTSNFLFEMPLPEDAVVHRS